MDTFFADHNITIRDVPFQLDTARKPTQKDIDIVNEEFASLSFELPSDYVAFCLANGGGTLGRVKIFMPYGDDISALDLRFQTYRLQNKFGDEIHQILHNFPMDKLIVFALDVIEHMWFGWCYGDEKRAGKLFCFQEDNRGPPPTYVADDFMEFLEEIAIGDRMVEDQIERLLEPREEIPSDLDRFGNHAEDEDSEEYHPPKTFVPFPQRRKC